MLNDFIKLILAEVNRSIYGWGGQGQKRGVELNEAYIRQREKGTGGYKSGGKIVETYADAAVKLWAKRVAARVEGISIFDCSGLGVWALIKLGLLKSDASANTLKGHCKALARAQLKRGDWAFYTNSAGKASHIGYIVNDALEIVEAKGRRDGVIKRSLAEFEATGKAQGSRIAYGRPKFFADEIEGKTATTKTTVEVIGGSVNIRAKADVLSSPVDIAHKGDRFRLVEKVDTFYKIGDARYISAKPQYTRLV